MKLKKVLAGLLAASLVISAAVPAMAASSTGGFNNAEGGTAGKSIQITKNLKIAEGIIVPNETFSFTITPGTQNSGLQTTGYAFDTGNYPAINSGADTIPYTNSSRAANGAAPSAGQDAASDVELVRQGTLIDLERMEFPHAGLYIYEIKETAGSTADMTYDRETYYLKVLVKNGTAPLYPDDIEVTKIENGAEKKVDATPGDITPGTSTDADGNNDNDGNDLRFTNTYKKQIDADAFYLMKHVEQSYADRNHAFKFTVTVDLPDTANPADYLKAADMSIPSLAGASNSTTPVQATAITDGNPATVYLMADQKLEIEKLPVGTKINITEEHTSHYVPRYTGKHDVDFNNPAERITIQGAKSVDTEDLSTETIVVGQNGAFVEYTNALNDENTTPTGIVINNLPYILVVALAGAGLLFFAMKRRAR